MLCDMGRIRLRPLVIVFLTVGTLARAGPAWARGVEEIFAEVRAATMRYLDIGKAREEGFVQISAMEPLHGYHFMNVNAQVLSTLSRAWAVDLDLAKPPILLYVKQDNSWQLVGVEYALPGQPAQNPFPGAQWHEHVASCHYRDYREVPAAGAAQCPSRHPESGTEFVLWHPALAVAHVWAWYPNPRGPFAGDNPYLAPYGGALSSLPSHGHARSGTEVAYSEFNHRSSGVFLLLIAAVIFWESRRQRAFPWNAISAFLWIAFGVYLFVRSDPEAWPWGPKAFIEIFTDPEVLQHKILTLIPVAIGVIEGFRAAGWLPHATWSYLFPGLAIFGGAYLFLHFHGGAFHWDWIYLQHAAMGLGSLAIGVTLFLVRRTKCSRSLLAGVFPVILLLLALVLLLYSESQLP